jgi:competence protein ComEC
MLVVAIGLYELGIRSMDNPVDSSSASIRLEPTSTVSRAITRIRRQPSRSLGSGSEHAIVEGVAFGRTDGVSAADKQAFLDSGLWHLLAASGQNIALVVLLCVGTAVVCGAGRAAGMVLALGAIPAYVLLVGGGASIIRAGIMGLIAVVAWLVGREVALRWSLVAAAAVLCWWFPGVHRGLGFQLSCSCVASLLIWGQPMSRWLQDRGVPRMLAAGVGATIICTLCTAPILLLRTGSAPALGGVANLVAVPLAGLVLVIGLPASIIASLWHPAGDVLLPLAGWCAAALRSVAHLAASMPGAQTSHPLVAIGGPAAAVTWWGTGRITASRAMAARTNEQRESSELRHAEVVRVLAVGGVVGVVAVTGGFLPDRVQRLPAPTTGTVRITFLDVGQGMASLVQTPTAAVLVDVGPAGAPTTRMLRHLDVEQLDGVVLSHNSADHRAGLPQVLQQLRPRWVVGPSHTPGVWTSLQAQVLVRYACAGDVIPIDRSTRLRVFNPPCGQHWPSVTGDVHNDNAMVVVVEHHDTRVLLSADCEAPILNRLGIGRVDVLAVAHHGSADPGLAHLLDSIQPGAAVISVGARNRYGHPSPSTLAELRSRRIPIWRTDRAKSIAVISRMHELRVEGGLHLA